MIKKGFSLVELVIVLAIIGTVTVVFLRMLPLIMRSTANVSTSERLGVVSNEIVEYIRQQKRIPAMSAWIGEAGSDNRMAAADVDNISFRDVNEAEFRYIADRTVFDNPCAIRVSGGINIVHGDASIQRVAYVIYSDVLSENITVGSTTDASGVQTITVTLALSKETSNPVFLSNILYKTDAQVKRILNCPSPSIQGYVPRKGFVNVRAKLPISIIDGMEYCYTRDSSNENIEPFLFDGDTEIANGTCALGGGAWVKKANGTVLAMGFRDSFTWPAVVAGQRNEAKVRVWYRFPGDRVIRGSFVIIMPANR